MESASYPEREGRDKNMRIIDTHAHYDDKAFDPDREEVLSSLPEAGVVYAVNVGASMAGAAASVELADRWPFMYAACGIHPDDVGNLDEHGMEKLRNLCAHPKCVAVGEIGLDYHWMVQPKLQQKRWFIRQLTLSKELSLPINVHSRDAAQDTFDIIREYHAGSTGGIIHCFSGSAQMALEYVKMGYYIGIGGVVTFKNGRVLKEVVSCVPEDRLVTETDAPYLAPVPYRGKRNRSDYIRYVIEQIASLKGQDTEAMARILFENGCRVYGLSPQK